VSKPCASVNKLRDNRLIFGVIFFISLDQSRTVNFRNEPNSRVLSTRVQASLATSADATTWAHKILKAKNSLTGEDAQFVEKAFEAKLAEMTQVSAGDDAELKPKPLPRARNLKSARRRRGSARSIDKSKLTFGEPRRYRNKEHLRFVASQCCLICGRQPSDAHHLRFAQPRALGRKVSDKFTVPLCRTHHREVHRYGNETAWWEANKIAPLPVAHKLWRQSRGSSDIAPVDVGFGKTKPKIANHAKSLVDDTPSQIGAPAGDQHAKPFPQ